jgi:hypothetical protein
MLGKKEFCGRYNFKFRRTKKSSGGKKDKNALWCALRAAAILDDVSRQRAMRKKFIKTFKKSKDIQLNPSIF